PPTMAPRGPCPRPAGPNVRPSGRDGPDPPMTATTSPSPRPLGGGPDVDLAVDAPPRRPLRRRLVLPGLTAVVLQLMVVAGDIVPAVDTLIYLESGRNLVEGNGFTRFGGPELHFPPLV